MPSPGKILSYFTNRIRVHVHVQRTRRATCTTYVPSDGKQLTVCVF